ncbi:MAG TPA: hypothetical protein VNY36_09045 [Bacteroidia bacterium]|jgi:hypothetical protein|nr:hypothetical protein [Bacteroidia bacterium]
MKTTYRFILLNIIFSAATTCCYAQSELKTSYTGKFNLIDDTISMQYRYMEFINTKGDSVYVYEFDTCLTAKGYQQLWDTIGAPTKLAPQMHNKKFQLTYSTDSIPNPFDQNQMLIGMTIKKMELIK